MEELRPCHAKTVLYFRSLNLGRFSAKDFEVQENGAVYLRERPQNLFTELAGEKAIGNSSPVP